VDAEASYEAPAPMETSCSNFVVVFGPPGSGKGTQAAILAEKLGIPAISTGAMLRDAVAEGSELGHRVEEIMNSGALVDDATMTDVLRARLIRQDSQEGFLLDGYPRTIEQAETLDRILADMDSAVGAVLMIRVPDEELIRRIVSRGRADDTAEVAATRLSVYREKTAPVLRIYEDRGVLHEIDGNRPIKAVTESLVGSLEGCN